MSNLHFYYPENDAALGLNVINYTPPRAGVELRRSGETLPMWFGEPGDVFFTEGVPAAWYDAVTQAFGVDVDAYTDGMGNGYTPAPWGWSRPVVQQFQRWGFTDAQLPSAQQLERLRQLSHRRTALAVAAALRQQFGVLAVEPGVDCTDTQEAVDAVHRFQRAMVKVPWSNSGRGVFDSISLPADELPRRVAGTIRRQGSITIEPYVHVAANYALLYHYAEGRAEYRGLSVFDCNANFAYTGNFVAPDHVLRQRLLSANPRLPLDDVAQAVGQVLETILGTDYAGPLGVDMLLPEPGGPSVAVAEVNLRRTMGHVCHAFAERYLSAESTAQFTILPRTDSRCALPADCRMDGHRVTEGLLDLTPPDRPFRYTLTIQK